jgi:hypothetical protein
MVYCCSNCDEELPDSIGAGDKCPHCGIYLEYEENQDGSVTTDSGERLSQSEYSKRRGKGGVIGGIVGGIVVGLLCLLRVARAFTR